MRMQSVFSFILPLLRCCSGSALSLYHHSLQALCWHLFLLHHHCPEPSDPTGHRWTGTADACWIVWLWPVGSAGAERRSADAPALTVPTLLSRSGSHSCCDAGGRARSSGGASPSPRCDAV